MNKRILVVDDDRNIRSILKGFLEDEEYEVDTASDGLIAWEKLICQNESYKAVLLDLNMPRLDGLQLIQMLRSRGERYLPPIIVFSANPDATRQAGEMGIRHVLTKPFDFAKILVLVAEESSLCYTAV